MQILIAFLIACFTWAVIDEYYEVRDLCGQARENIEVSERLIQESDVLMLNTSNEETFEFGMYAYQEAVTALTESKEAYNKYCGMFKDETKHTN